MPAGCFGRAQISNITSGARVKYPMKRKNWSPDDPHGELRGKDEWERISWDEALDYIADEIRKSLTPIPGMLLITLPFGSQFSTVNMAATAGPEAKSPSISK